MIDLKDEESKSYLHLSLCCLLCTYEPTSPSKLLLDKKQTCSYSVEVSSLSESCTLDLVFFFGFLSFCRFLLSFALEFSLDDDSVSSLFFADFGATGNRPCFHLSSGGSSAYFPCSLARSASVPRVLDKYSSKPSEALATTSKWSIVRFDFDKPESVLTETGWASSEHGKKSSRSSINQQGRLKYARLHRYVWLIQQL